MSRVNKLHELLFDAAVWTDELKEQAFEYLDAHTSPLYVVVFAEMTGNELVVADGIWGRKKDVLHIILNQASPQAVLKAWEWIKNPTHADEPIFKP